MRFLRTVHGQASGKSVCGKITTMKHASFPLLLTLCVVLFVSVHVGAENNSAIGLYAGLSQGFGSSFAWRSSGRTSQRGAFRWTGGFYLQHSIGKAVALMLDLSMQNGSEMDRVSWYPDAFKRKPEEFFGRCDHLERGFYCFRYGQDLLILSCGPRCHEIDLLS